MIVVTIRDRFFLVHVRYINTIPVAVELYVVPCVRLAVCSYALDAQSIHYCAEEQSKALALCSAQNGTVHALVVFLVGIRIKVSGDLFTDLQCNDVFLLFRESCGRCRLDVRVDAALDLSLYGSSLCSVNEIRINIDLYTLIVVLILGFKEEILRIGNREHQLDLVDLFCGKSQV